MEAIKLIIGNVEEFLDKVYANVNNLGIDISAYLIDHIAYRTTTHENYAKLKNQLQKYGVVISEIILKERPVAIIKLNVPLKYKQQEIYYFEILAPAKGDIFKEGLEHAEFVIDISLDEFLKKYSNINFNTKSLDRKINPELILGFENDANVKFHELPINKVIEIEKINRL